MLLTPYNHPKWGVSCLLCRWKLPWSLGFVDYGQPDTGQSMCDYRAVWHWSSTRDNFVPFFFSPCTPLTLSTVQHRRLPSANILRWLCNSRMYQAWRRDRIAGEWTVLLTGVSCSSTSGRLKNWWWSWEDHGLQLWYYKYHSVQFQTINWTGQRTHRPSMRRVKVGCTSYADSSLGWQHEDCRHQETWQTDQESWLCCGWGTRLLENCGSLKYRQHSSAYYWPPLQSVEAEQGSTFSYRLISKVFHWTPVKFFLPTSIGLYNSLLHHPPTQ